jgi:hypothetical protein
VVTREKSIKIDDVLIKMSLFLQGSATIKNCRQQVCLRERPEH